VIPVDRPVDRPVDGPVDKPVDRPVDRQRTPLGVVMGQLAADDPDAPALTHEGRTLSRAELDRRTTRLAHAYADRGVQADDFVTIGLPNGIEYFEAVLACWKLGANPPPVSHRLPAIERREIIALAQPALVVGVSDDDAGGRVSVPAGFEPEPRPGYDEPLPPVIGRSWKAPTSGGSTGRPKLIVAGQRGYVENVRPIAEMGQIRADSTCVVTGPLYHSAPFQFSVAGLLIGAHQVVMTRFDPSQTLELVERYRADWLYMVPTMMQRIWRLPDDEKFGRDLSSLKVVYHLAAPCPPWLKQAWIDWLGAETIWELYGGTEAQAVTVLNGKEWLEHRGSVGRPWLGEIKVLGPDGEELAPGETGTVWMRRGEGKRASYEYIGATARATADGWESLGDVGRLDEDGYLYLADRETDMILVGGANVYPAEIEAALDEHPLVSSSCVIGLPHDDLGNVPHAIVHVTGEVSDDDLERHLRDRLAPYKIPRSFERTDEPLRDDAGKMRRPALRAERLSRQRG
jgi:bile acid-coenzyme A ligase